MTVGGMGFIPERLLMMMMMILPVGGQMNRYGGAGAGARATGDDGAACV